MSIDYIEQRIKRVIIDWVTCPLCGCETPVRLFDREHFCACCRNYFEFSEPLR